MYNLLKLLKGGWKSHNILLKAYHTLKSKTKLCWTCLSFWASQHPTPRQPLGGSPQRLPISPELSSFLAWNSCSKQRSLRLSGLLFLRRQWGALRNNCALSYRYLYIQREKSAQLCNTLFSPGVGSRSTCAFSLFSSLPFDYFMKRMFCFFPF